MTNETSETTVPVVSEGVKTAECPNGECDGTGRIVDHFEGDPDHWTDIGNGLVMGAMSGSTSRLCSCRKNLPKRDGTAAWWGTSEQIFEDIVEFAMFDEHATLSVGVETCISEDNYLVHRTAENAYYPPVAHLEMSDTDLTWLLPDDLRALAAMFMAAADKCDEIEPADGRTTRPLDEVLAEIDAEEAERAAFTTDDCGAVVSELAPSPSEQTEA